MNFDITRYDCKSISSPNKKNRALFFQASLRSNNQSLNPPMTMKVYKTKTDEEQELIQEEVTMNLIAQEKGGVLRVKGYSKKQRESFKENFILLDSIKHDLYEEILIRKQNMTYFTTAELHSLIEQLLKTFSNLQQAQIAHRCIELESIFFDMTNKLVISDFSRSKNLIGQEQSEIREINMEEIKTARFPDKESIQALKEGKNEGRINYFKMDVYSLGIVCAQLATLNIFSNIQSFYDNVQDVFKQIDQRYTGQVAHLIRAMVSERELRPDFVVLYKQSKQPYKTESLKSEVQLRNDLTLSSSSGIGSREQIEQDQDFENSLNDRSSITDLEKDQLDYILQSQNMLAQSLNRQDREDNPLENPPNINPNYPPGQIQYEPHVPVHKQNNPKYQLPTIQEYQNRIPTLPPSTRNNTQNHQQIRFAESITNNLHPPRNTQPSMFDPNIGVAFSESKNYTVPPEQYNDEYKQDNSDERQSEYLEEKWMKRSNRTDQQINPNLSYLDLLWNIKQTCKDLRIIDESHFRIYNRIGGTNHSTVWECNTRERNYCVIKILKPRTNAQVLAILQSINRFQASPVKLTSRIEFIHLVQGKNDKETVLMMISKKKTQSIKTLDTTRISFAKKLMIAEMITQTLLELHMSKPSIIHGALKPSNILLNLEYEPFLADFGFSQIQQQTSFEQQQEMFRSLSFKTGFSAPEVLKDMVVCAASDVWSLGLIFYQLFYEQPVTYRLSFAFSLYDSKKKGCLDLTQHLKTGVAFFLAQLIRDMTAFDYEHRLSLDKVQSVLNNIRKNFLQMDPYKKKIPVQQAKPSTPTIYHQQQQQQLQKNNLQQLVPFQNRQNSMQLFQPPLPLYKQEKQYTHQPQPINKMASRKKL